jgi:hypothetical protein
VRSHRYRYGFVLVLILASLTFGLAAPDGDWPRLIIVVLQAATLVAAVAASQAHRWLLRLAVVVAVLFTAGAMATLLGSDEFGNDSARLISLILVAMASPAIVYGIVKEYRVERSVTLHTMFGVLCLYLLLGMLFASGLEAIQSVSNETMLKPGSTASSHFLYFSFVSLTTTGFGDIVAATNVGRSFSVTESLIGQIYLVTVVALIVGNLRPRARARA